MTITLENQIASAHKSLRAMFPTARTISVDLETEKHFGESGGAEVVMTWSIYVVRESYPNIQASDKCLSKAVARAMLDSVGFYKMQAVAMQAFKVADAMPRASMN
jgi:hypothetical protein